MGWQPATAKDVISSKVVRISYSGEGTSRDRARESKRSEVLLTDLRGAGGDNSLLAEEQRRQKR
jgi:hypothetical protein